MATHDSLALELTDSDRLLSLMPLFHLHVCHCAGTTVARRQRHQYAGSIRATFWHASGLRPTWFTSAHPEPRYRRVSTPALRSFRNLTLRFIRSGTAALEPQLLTSLEEAAGVPVLNGLWNDGDRRRRSQHT